MKREHHTIFNRLQGLVLFLLVSGGVALGQLSPGPLSNAHASLEGISNCTKCHSLGNKVVDDKCLACHTEIQKRITAGKGYHASTDVKGTPCFACHSEHNGKNFELARLEQSTFSHELTGFTLSAPHSKKQCFDCHNKKFINEPGIKKKNNSYLGLNNQCLTCHADYHQQTLSSSCLDCHSDNAFKPAAKFDHSKAKFQLVGKHKSVDCLKCHKKETVNGKVFQEFKGVAYSNCTSCHKDPHQNQFGQNCKQCHNEESFHSVAKGLTNFNHDKTGFKLEGRHQLVSCSQCHKTKLTDPLKHDKCTDCHQDYHKGQFVKNGAISDCINCHTTKGFTQFSYTMDMHNSGKFPLNGAHAAVPCIDCHRKKPEWSFRQIGQKCSDCHVDVHKNMIQAKYYPGSSCTACHVERTWKEISFDHAKTGFALTGAHKVQNCVACHIRDKQAGISSQKFTGLKQDCSTCHDDNHHGQFSKGGITTCTTCHGTENWKASLFDHSKTAFKLDGKHAGVACAKCHKPQKEGSVSYVVYKIKDFRCESCH